MSNEFGSNIKVEQYLTLARQKELIALADSGMGANAVRLAVKEAIHASQSGIVSSAAASEDPDAYELRCNKFPILESCADILLAMEDVICNDKSVLYWKEGVEIQQVNILKALPMAFEKAGVDVDLFRIAGPYTNMHMSQCWTYYNQLEARVADSGRYAMSQYTMHGHRWRFAVPS